MASTPITFSGFNEIDFNLVLNAVMQQASQPLVAIQNRQTALRSQVTTFDLLANRVFELREAAEELGDMASVSGVSGTSSNTAALSVSTSGDAVPGDYDVVVNTLARAQVTASNSSAPDATTTVVASGGSITIGGVAVSIGGDVTLQGLADAINNTDGIGVNASVVRTGTTAYRLVLTSQDTGVAGAFTLTNGLTGGTGVTFTDTNFNGTIGDSVEDNAVQASDASLLVNNIPVTGSSNIFDDVVPGVTITALRADPAETIHVSVVSDSTGLEEDVTAFIDAYNGMVKFVNDQRTAAAGGDASSIGRDPLLRQLHSRLRAELLGVHGAGTFTRLSEIGVEFTITGTLELDSDRLREAVTEDPDAVRDFFAGATGVFPAVETMLVEYSESNGYISSLKDRLTDQIERMDGQIATMQARLAIQRDGLMREFIAADQAMSRLKSQTSSLATFGGGLGSL
jgi:flagellar hook-associated protein 2